MSAVPANSLNPQSKASTDQYSFGYSNNCQNVVLVGDVAQTVSVPGADLDSHPYTRVSINATANIFVNFNGQTAVIPSVNIGPNSNGCVLNPSTKYIDGLTSFSIISSINCVVSLEWFA